MENDMGIGEEIRKIQEYLNQLQPGNTSISFTELMEVLLQGNMKEALNTAGKMLQSALFSQAKEGQVLLVQVPGPMKRLWTWLPKICCPVVLTAWSMPTVPDIRFQTMQIWRSGQPVKELTCREKAKNVRSGELQQLSWPSVETRVLSAFLLLVRS